MHHELEVLADPDGVASAGAAFVAKRARDAVVAKGGFTFAVSGGCTPWETFGELAFQDVPWKGVVIYQVDERVAPPDDGRCRLCRARCLWGYCLSGWRPQCAAWRPFPYVTSRLAPTAGLSRIMRGRSLTPRRWPPGSAPRQVLWGTGCSHPRWWPPSSWPEAARSSAPTLLTMRSDKVTAPLASRNRK
jgi:Glucosamine-6-phosphate isomerases/6-phosphogluconolactonase